MQPKTRYYLYRFKLFVNSVAIPNSEDQIIQIVWKSPRCLRIYNQLPYYLKNSEAKIQTQIEIEEILIKNNLQESFQSLESQILIQKHQQNSIRESLATLKIDLHDLALSDHFHEIKVLNMYSHASQGAWIQIGLSEISGMQLTQEEAIAYERSSLETCQVVQIKSETSYLETIQQKQKDKRSPFKKASKKNKKRTKNIQNYQTMVKIVDGKDLIITQFQQKTLILIESLRQARQKINNIQKSKNNNTILIQPLDIKTERSKSMSQQKYSFLPKEASFRNGSMIARELSFKEKNSIDKIINSDELQIVELKNLIEQLQEQNNLLKDKFRHLQTNLQQYKEIKEQLYGSKKKNILLNQQNDELKSKINDLRIQIDMHSQHQLNQIRVMTQKQQGRLLTCASQPDNIYQQGRFEDEIVKVRQKHLLQEIQRLRARIRESDLQSINLKRLRSLNEKDIGKPNQIEEMIKSRMLELSTKYACAEQQLRANTIKLQSDLNCLNQEKKDVQRQNQIMIKKYDNLKQLYDKLKQSNSHNERKLIILNRLENKNKDLQQINKKFHLTIQKLEADNKQKHKQWLELSYNRSFRNKEERASNMTDSVEIWNGAKKRAALINGNGVRRNQLRNSIREIQSAIKQCRQKSNVQDSEEIKQHENQIKQLQIKLKNQINELQTLGEEPITPTMRNQFLSRLPVQQLLQQNQELRGYVKQLVKKVVNIETISPSNRLQLQVKQQQIVQRQKRLQEKIQDVCMEITDNEAIDRSSFLSNINAIKQLHSQIARHLEQELKQIIQYESQLNKLESNIKKRQVKMDALEQGSSLKKMSNLSSELKWKEADMFQFSEMKKKEKDLKIKINSLQSKALNDRMEFENEKQDLIKKYKQEQRKFLVETKEVNDKQITNWKNQINQLEKKVREKEIQVKQLKNNIQLTKSTSQYQQKVSSMKISQCNLKIDDISSHLQQTSQLYKNEIGKNKYSMQTIKELNLTINKLTSMVEAKQSELQNLEDKLRQYKQQSDDLIAQMQAKYRQLDDKDMQEKKLLGFQIQRLKLLVEDEVIKSVKFQDEYKVLCQTINDQEKNIQELYLKIQQKQQVINQMNERYQLKIEEIQIMEEEYNKVLETIKDQNIKYSLLKGEYTSLEIIHEKAQQFIKNLETSKEEDRKILQQKLEEKDKEKRAYINQINQMLKQGGERDVQYRKSINQFELHSMKLDQLLEQQKIKSRSLCQDVEMLTKQRQQLRHQISNLSEQLESRIGRRDKKKKKMGLNLQPAEKSAFQGGFSKNQVQKQLSYVGSAAQGHKSSSLEQYNIRNYGCQQPFTPISVHDRNQIHLHLDQTSQEFLYPTQRGNEAFTMDNPPQIKVTDQNGEQIVRSPMLRSSSLNSKNKYLPKIEPLQQLYEQQAEKQSKQHSKQYKNKQAEHSSDDEEDRLKEEEIENYKKTIEYLDKELSQKRAIITELETINKKNQIQMNQTKKYLQMSIKRKSIVKRSLTDLEPQSPQGSHTRQNKQKEGEQIADSLKQMEFIGQQLDTLEQQLRVQKQINIRYQEQIKHMGEEFVEQQIETGNLLKTISSLSEQINSYKIKEQELQNQIQKLIQEIGVKQRLIKEFEQVIKNKEEAAVHYQNVIQDLQKQIQDGQILRSRIQVGLQQTNQQLLIKQKELATSATLREQMSKRIQILNDELFQIKQQIESKGSIIQQKQKVIRQCYLRIETLENDIENMAEKYLLIEDHIKQNKGFLEDFERKIAQRAEKHDQTLKRVNILEREKGLLQLKIKENQSTILLKTRIIDQKESEVSKISEQLVKRERQYQMDREQSTSILKQLQQQIKGRDLNIQLLKKDIAIFNNQNKKLKDQQEKSYQEQDVSDGHMRQLISTFEVEMASQKNKALVLQEQIKKLQKVIDQQKAELQEINQIQKLRGNLVQEVERSNIQTVRKLEAELKIINEEIQKRMDLNAEEIKMQYQQKLSMKDMEYNKLKLTHTRQMKKIQEERYQMFSQKCELEETRISMAEKQEDYKNKIQKYEGSIKSICGKLKNIQTERPHIQLFQEVTFQNEIFRNRIAQLEEMVTFKERANIDYREEQVQQMRNRYMQQKQEYLSQLQNYSMQVAELEEKNYQLSSELQQIRYEDYNDLRQQNEELEKSITRLQTCEQELRRELQLIKHKRQEEYKQYLSDLRALRAK